MKTIKKYLTWIMWVLWYLPQPRTRNLEKSITRGMRLRRPWWRFKPNIRHNDGMSEWQVWLKDTPCYSEVVMMPMDISRCQDTGEIVGIDLWDVVISDPDRYKLPLSEDYWNSVMQLKRTEKK